LSDEVGGIAQEGVLFDVDL